MFEPSTLLMNMCRRGCGCSFRSFHFTAINQASPFVKAQKKIDPEVARVREERKRRKLAREIRLLEKFGKKLKPIDEFVLDKQYENNIGERTRYEVKLTAEEADERIVAKAEYLRYLNGLAQMDLLWMQESVRKQEKALRILKGLSPGLYAAALKPDEHMMQGFVFHGPTLTPPVEGYGPPDGQYVDIPKVEMPVQHLFCDPQCGKREHSLAKLLQDDRKATWLS